MITKTALISAHSGRAYGGASSSSMGYFLKVRAVDHRIQVPGQTTFYADLATPLAGGLHTRINV